jgi:arylsulfatase A-like enzyme
MTLEMSTSEMLQLESVILVLNALVGAIAALPSALWARWSASLPRWLGGALGLARRYQVAFTLGVMVLSGFFLVPLARELWLTERREGAIGMVFLCALMGVLAWFNSGYWFRRWLVGAGPALGYRLGTPAISGLLALLGFAVRGPAGPSQPVYSAEQPNVFLITIDTLRRDHVGVYGGLVSTPAMDALGRAGLIFDDAITTVPETLPSHSAMFTGNQPARTKVLSNGNHVSRSFLTVTEQLGAAGYRTGAFVSSFALDSETGLDQGFQVYDDDFFPWVRGFSQTGVARVVLPLFMRVSDPADYPFLLERSSPETIRRALAWAAEPPDANDPRPVFGWLHLFDPHAPYEVRPGFPVSEQAAAIDHRAILAQEPGYPYRPEEVAGLQELYRQECAYADSQVAVFVDGLRAAGLLNHAIIIVLGDHGESLGQHNIYFNHHGIFDDVLRIPLLVWTSEMAGADGAVHGAGQRFSRTVTTADVANTLLGYSGVSPLTGTQSTNLLGFVNGDANTDTSLTVQGREGASLTERQLCGVRSPNAKYIRKQDATELLFDLVNDPAELQDIGAAHADALANGRAGTVRCVANEVVGPTSADECARLQALGYVEDCP